MSTTGDETLESTAGDGQRTQVGFLVGLHTNPEWEDATSAGELYARAPWMAREAEELGFDSMFFTEHHRSPNGECPSPLVIAAAAAVTTKTLKLGTGVALPAFYHPVKMAEDAAVVDNLSGGRLLLGVGLGYRDHEFAMFGVPKKLRGGYLNEALEILVRLGGGETVDFLGEHFQIQGAEVKPCFVQKPLSVWLGAQRRPGFSRAVRYGLPVPIAVAPLPMAIRQRQMHLDAVAAEPDAVMPATFPIIREAFVAETDEQAWALAEPGIRRLYQEDYIRFAPIPVESGSGGYRFTSDPRDDAFDDLRLFGRDRMIIGSPETVLSELRRHSRSLPCDHWILRMHLPGTPIDAVESSMKLFSQEVLPSLHGSAETIN